MTSYRIILGGFVPYEGFYIHETDEKGQETAYVALPQAECYRA